MEGVGKSLRSAVDLQWLMMMMMMMNITCRGGSIVVAAGTGGIGGWTGMMRIVHPKG